MPRKKVAISYPVTVGALFNINMDWVGKEVSIYRHNFGLIYQGKLIDASEDILIRHVESYSKNKIYVM